MQLARIAGDPALPAVTQSTLQRLGSSLTTFQVALLQAILVLTYNQEALVATISGMPLTRAQRITMDRVRGTLSMNRSIQRLQRAGATLKGQPQVLQTGIDRVIVAAHHSVPLGSVTSNAAVTAVIGDCETLLDAPDWRSFKQSLIPVMRERGFLSYLRSQDPLIVATFMPSGQVLALELPHGVDPPLEPLIKGFLEILFNLALAIVAIVTAPEELTPTAVLGLIGAPGWLALSLFNYLQLLCSDFDKDGDCD